MPDTTTTRQLDVPVDGLGVVPLTLTDRGEGPVHLLLHGGGGPATVEPFADLLAAGGARVLTPVHPGFGGTPRPEGLRTPRDLAALLVAALEQLDLRDVTVVGNSLGGWVAAELGALGSPRVGRLVLVDAVGLAVADHPVVDFFSLTPAQVAELSWADPTGRALDPASLPEPARAALAGNRAALAVYGGTAMTDPTLGERLASIAVPTLVVWGDADRIVDPAVGRAYAAAVPGARLELLARSGHLPQLETPEELLALVRRA